MCNKLCVPALLFHHEDEQVCSFCCSEVWSQAGCQVVCSTARHTHTYMSTRTSRNLPSSSCTCDAWRSYARPSTLEYVCIELPALHSVQRTLHTNFCGLHVHCRMHDTFSESPCFLPRLSVCIPHDQINNSISKCHCPADCSPSLGALGWLCDCDVPSARGCCSGAQPRGQFPLPWQASHGEPIWTYQFSVFLNLYRHSCFQHIYEFFQPKQSNLRNAQICQFNR